MRTETAAGRLLLGACLTAVFGTASAVDPAATILRADGFTIVSKGAQYVKAHEGMALNEGDRLIVMEGQTAIIGFADGCQYTLTDREVLTVGPTSTCAADATGSYKVDPYSGIAQHRASVKQAALEPPAPPEEPPVGYVSDAGAGGGLDSGLIAAGVGGVIVVGAIIASNNDDSNNQLPRSP